MIPMEKRYQIFISSTFRDLVDERRAVLEAILSLKHMPVGMEYFPAATTSTLNYIKSMIDDCDYYVLLVSGRYGTIDVEGISYTEREFNYAVSKNKPIIVFLRDDLDSLPRSKTEVESNLWDKLLTFRTKASKDRICQFWGGPEDLKAKVMSSLMSAFVESPARGWVRPIISEVHKESKTGNNNKDGRTFQLNKVRSVNDILENELRNIDEKSVDNAINLGFADLDTFLNGLRPGGVLLVASRPSMGRRSFSANICLNAAWVGHPVMIFSSRENSSEFTERLLSCFSGIQVNSARRSAGQIKNSEMDQARDWLSRVDIRVDDSLTHDFESLSGRCRDQNFPSGNAPLIIIDAIDGIDIGHRGNHDIGILLKSLATELSAVIIVFGSLKRALEARPNKRPILADLDQLGPIGKQSDAIIFLYKDDLYHPDSEVLSKIEFIVARSRYGMLGSISYPFDFKVSRFITKKAGLD